MFDLSKKARAYKSLFLGEGGKPNENAKIVLEDLMKFCHVNETCLMISSQGTVDPLATVHAEGRREVFLRLNEFLNITQQQLAAIQEQYND